MMSKEQVLAGVLALNNANEPWEIRVENDSIIATWKWMDARFFDINQLSDATKSYKFIVTLLDNGKWKEQDYKEEKDASLGRNGLHFGTSISQGHMVEKTITWGLGQDKQSGNIGVLSYQLDTSKIKAPIRAYLERCGWKKKGFFG